MHLRFEFIEDLAIIGWLGRLRFHTCTPGDDAVAGEWRDAADWFDELLGSLARLRAAVSVLPNL